ncbi:hypothetical protein ART_1573 [Arthrobacter sp. PAMC 25486]|uniref:hypothetical protein n=1 Tax=Arthrobacter sp. PAMC 25486 TaxID=1494608 RepID=UPI000535CCEB|nr:hypothetical protein [Arthrobacter sp. PAMC 25486]AIY01172.1 hypothetical protein ART_1573 [Arthrobacter sp. PAMC 25486]
MPENDTATGFKNRIIEAVPGVNHNFAARCANRIKRRADRMQEEFDFYESLRILGLVSDTTARDAVRNLETVTA